jgi:two-component system, NtrC family, response regulator GlrR
MYTGSMGLEFRDETEHHVQPQEQRRRLALEHVQLRWVDALGAKQHRVYERAVVGSAESADLFLRDAAVSRLHVELVLADGQLWARDLGSRNGTFINGLRIKEAVLPHEATLRIGSSELGVHYVYSDARTQEVWPDNRFGLLVGRSEPMHALYTLLAQVAPTQSSVLICGETGTGKELVAQMLHDRSLRKQGPMVTVDCAALPENLLDAELFGHAKGAFTGAVAAREGAFEAASGGTIFLDEVGELPLSMQPKLLRVLESRTIRRLGETQHRAIDVRVLAATHRNLLEMVNRGEFREDLYFRLAVVPIYVAPLRERLADLDLLVRGFLGNHEDAGREDRIEALRLRPWRGNVRELRNFVERWRALGFDAALSTQPTLRNSPEVSAVSSPANVANPALGVAPASFDLPLRDFRDLWIEAGERSYVEQLMRRFNGKVAEAAKSAEVDRTYLYKIIRKYFR